MLTRGMRSVADADVEVPVTPADVKWALPRLVEQKVLGLQSVGHVAASDCPPKIQKWRNRFSPTFRPRRNFGEQA